MHSFSINGQRVLSIIADLLFASYADTSEKLYDQDFIRIHRRSLRGQDIS